MFKGLIAFFVVGVSSCVNHDPLSSAPSPSGKIALTVDQDYPTGATVRSILSNRVRVLPNKTMEYDTSMVSPIRALTSKEIQTCLGSVADADTVYKVSCPSTITNASYQWDCANIICEAEPQGSLLTTQQDSVIMAMLGVNQNAYLYWHGYEWWNEPLPHETDNAAQAPETPSYETEEESPTNDTDGDSCPDYCDDDSGCIDANMSWRCGRKSNGACGAICE